MSHKRPPLHLFRYLRPLPDPGLIDITAPATEPPPYIWPSRLQDYQQWIDIPLRSVLPPVEVIIPPHDPQS